MVTLTVFGEQAKKLAAQLGLEMDGNHTGRNTRVYFTYHVIEGRPKIIVELDVQ